MFCLTLPGTWQQYCNEDKENWCKLLSDHQPFIITPLKQEERFRKTVKDLSHLFGLHKVGHLSIIICSSDVESCAGSLWAEAGEDAGLGLSVPCIDGPYLHTPTHQPQQPVITVYSIVFQVQVQRLVPIDLWHQDKHNSKHTNKFSVSSEFSHLSCKSHSPPPDHITHSEETITPQRQCRLQNMHLVHNY